MLVQYKPGDHTQVAGSHTPEKHCLFLETCPIFPTGPRRKSSKKIQTPSFTIMLCTYAKAAGLAPLFLLLAVTDAADGLEVPRGEDCIVVSQQCWALERFHRW